MTTSISDTFGSRLRAEAQRQGFDACGVARIPETWTAAERLDAFLDAGRHGDMAWMETTRARRRHPRAMWPEARSAVMLALNYGPDEPPLAALERRTCGAISVYARGEDYHDVVKRRLKALAGWLQAETGAAVKVFVDTAPILEKPLAAAAGLGWQGKHTNLVSRAHGSWLFLGAVLTEAELAPDASETDHCGQCSACLEACPTRAFPAPYQLDARLCLSYLTIEHSGPVPERLRPALGARVYGCDDCLAVCPWNKFASEARVSALHAREALKAPQLAELAALDDARFRTLFTKSPVKRIGRDRFVRNVLYAIGNSDAPDLRPAAEALLEDPDETVRDAAGWATARLRPGAAPRSGGA